MYPSENNPSGRVVVAENLHIKVVLVANPKNLARSQPVATKVLEPSENPKKHAHALTYV